MGNKTTALKNLEKARAKVAELNKIPDGENSKTTKHLLRLWQLNIDKPLDTNDAVAVQERLLEYMKITMEDDQRPTFEDMCVALGVTRDTVFKWRRGDIKKNPDVVKVIEDFIPILQARLVSQMVNQQILPANAIFLLKNNYENYKDQQDVKFSTDTPLSSSTNEQLNEKYLKNVRDVGATEIIDITDNVEDVE